MLNESKSPHSVSWVGTKKGKRKVRCRLSGREDDIIVIWVGSRVKSGLKQVVGGFSIEKEKRTEISGVKNSRI